MDWFEIFAAGTHTDSNGVVREWTEDDLRQIASLYNPAEHEAPIVIGHPETDSPAYGWVEALKVEAGKLMAKPGQVVDEFKEWVKQGLYKKISIAIYPDLSLKHVGFLGGVPPAVKGLKPAQFKAGEANSFEMDVAAGFSLRTATENTGRDTHPEGCGYETANPNKGGSHMREFFEKLKALFMEAEKTLVPDQGAKFTEAEVAARVSAKEAEFAEAQRKKDSEIAEKEKKIKEREAALAAEEAKKRKDGIAAFCEGLLQKGILIPAMMKHGMGLAVFMEQIAEIQQEFAFSEDAAKKQTPLEFMQSFLGGLPKAIEFGEVAGRDKEGPTGATASEKLEALTQKKMKENKDLSYKAAFAEVQKENVELALELLEEVRPKK